MLESLEEVLEKSFNSILGTYRHRESYKQAVANYKSLYSGVKSSCRTVNNISASFTSSCGHVYSTKKKGENSKSPYESVIHFTRSFYYRAKIRAETFENITQVSLNSLPAG